MTATTKPNWTMPDGRRVPKVTEDDRARWLKERRNGIGGTDAAALMGVHITTTMSVPDYTAADVFLDKTSPVDPSEEDKDIFHLGHVLEAALLAQAEERYGITTKPAGFIRRKGREDSFMYANPDALASDGGLVECKSASNRRNRHGVSTGDLWLAGDVSKHAYTQGQHYLLVTGRSHVYFTVAIRDDFSGWESVPREFWGEQWFRDLAIKEYVQVGPIPRDETLIAELMDVERWMWTAIKAGEMPSDLVGKVDPLRLWPTAIPGQEVEPLVPQMFSDDLERLAAIKDTEKALAAERKVIEGRVKTEIGAAEYLVIDGVRRMRWKTTKASSFDKDGLTKDHPDLVEEYTTRGTARRLEVVK